MFNWYFDLASFVSHLNISKVSASDESTVLLHQNLRRLTKFTPTATSHKIVGKHASRNGLQVAEQWSHIYCCPQLAKQASHIYS
jgi:hypothetical protein